MKEKVLNVLGTIVLIILGVLFPAVKMAYVAIMVLSLLAAIAWLLVPEKAEVSEVVEQTTSVTA